MRQLFAVVVLVFLCVPAWAGDINFHEGLGNAVGLLRIQNSSTGADLYVELFVLTAYPYPGAGARILGYDCLDSRDSGMVAACGTVDSVTHEPEILEGCTDIEHFSSSSDGQTITAWTCLEGVGKCVDTWSELNPDDSTGSKLPEVQVLNLPTSSLCSSK